ncbi:MAG: metallophosphoesterase [Anaerolineales bacterium]
MKIAVLSDSHDNIWKLEAAMPHLRVMDAVIHCGDLCAPFIVKRLGEGLSGIPIHIVWGNNDGDPWRIARVAAAYPNIQLHGEVARLEIDGVKIGVNHYPEIARDLARSGSYDLVCFGHDHTAYEGMEDSCLLLNPGELMGMNGRSTLALYDSQTKLVQMIEV